ncbi:hypothetical protein [Thorsellia kenyensis]|uniref:Uncharacterized protein n=1 Tax=Thorsellia kenyensis TaxID=1549888 RepID=A0ABV6CD35_9GAMM
MINTKTQLVDDFMFDAYETLSLDCDFEYSFDKLEKQSELKVTNSFYTNSFCDEIVINSKNSDSQFINLPIEKTIDIEENNCENGMIKFHNESDFTLIIENI